MYNKNQIFPKKVIYLGSRHYCYLALADNPKYEIVKILTFDNSPLQRYLNDLKKDYELVKETDRTYVQNLLLALKFDILVCNGCPFILPASKLQAQGKILLNTHSSYLPYLRGKLPINGVLLYRYPMGATTHYITDIVDGGNIIYQKKIPLTRDIDLGLCYYISYTIQAEVFAKALKILERHNFKFEGKQNDFSMHPIFCNREELRVLNFKTMSADECVMRIKAYGVKEEGCYASIQSKCYRIYDGESVINRYLLQKFSIFLSGEIVLKYDTCMLIKCRQGILKVKKYKICNAI